MVGALLTKKRVTAPPQSIRERTGRLLKMAGSMATQELSRRIQGKGSVESALSLSQIQTLVGELAHLKGAAMKLGQLFALEARDYFPEEICEVLDQLQSDASSLDFHVIESILQQELGQKYDSLTDFSVQPIAAASIGQVHRAKLPSGVPVAVKVQYPGIKDSVHSDVKVLGTLMKTISVLMGKQVNLSELVGEFSEIFIQEADYEKEALFSIEYQKFAREVPDLVVPSVHPEFSTAKVLTMNYETGIKLNDWLKTSTATREMRTFYGELILDLYSREFCDWGLVQTDPNLGNFFFRPSERKLVLLDFGATKRYDLEFRKLYAQLIMATLAKNKGRVLSLGEEMGLIDPREAGEAKEVFKDLLFESMRPMTLPEYDFGESAYPEKMRALSRELVKALRYSAPPKKLIFLHRKLSGIFYILRALNVKLPLTQYTERYQALIESN